MSAHSRVSILLLHRSFWWYVGCARGYVELLSSVILGFQTTRIKGIMPKGLEVELELLGLKGRKHTGMLSRLTHMVPCLQRV